MHLSVRIPKLDPNAIQPPTCYPFKHPQTKRRCTDTHFKLPQALCWPKSPSERVWLECTRGIK